MTARPSDDQRAEWRFVIRGPEDGPVTDYDVTIDRLIDAIYAAGHAAALEGAEWGWVATDGEFSRSVAGEMGARDHIRTCQIGCRLARLCVVDAPAQDGAE